MTLLIAQITDTHITSSGVYVNTHENLMKVISRINNLKPLPNLVIHTGDLTDKGDVTSYVEAREIMNHLKIPYFITCGNHDDHDNLQKTFNQPWISKDLACMSLIHGQQKIIILDSTNDKKVSGILCSKRLEWLESELKTDKDIYIFMHHYPIVVQHIFRNPHNLINADEFAKMLTSNVKSIYCGHYHIGCYGLFAGIPCIISPGVVPQFDARNVADAKDLYLLKTPPAFTLHQFDPNSSRIVFCVDEIKIS